MNEREYQDKEPEQGRADEESDPPADANPAAIEANAPADRLARLQAEKDDLMQTLVRRQADFDNYRKRVERERQDDRRHGTGRLVEDLLPVLDAFERALKAHDDPAYEEYRKGLELIYRQLWDTLSRHGLQRIEALGKPFDPHYHQAIEQVESDEHPEGTVTDVLQDGFLFHGRVVRPSMVRVASGAGNSGRGKTTAAQRHGK